MAAVDRNDIAEVENILDMATHLNVSKDLIDTVNLEGKGPLYQASWKGFHEICKVLLDNNCDPNLCEKDGRSPLYKASGEGHSTAVETLVNCKASVDQPMNDGTTPLIIASQNGHFQVVETLIKNGANPFKERYDGSTALYQAAWMGQTKVVQILLSTGVPLTHKSFQNETILHGAARGNRIETAKYILQQDRDNELVNDRRNDYNESPLTLTIQFDGQLQMVKTLIQYNADPNLIGNGKSPLEWAQQRGKQDIVKYLQTNVIDKS